MKAPITFFLKKLGLGCKLVAWDLFEIQPVFSTSNRGLFFFKFSRGFKHLIHCVILSQYEVDRILGFECTQWTIEDITSMKQTCDIWTNLHRAHLGVELAKRRNKSGMMCCLVRASIIRSGQQASERISRRFPWASPLLLILYASYSARPFISLLFHWWPQRY
jgi:hypothetical protein